MGETPPHGRMHDARKNKTGRERKLNILLIIFGLLTGVTLPGSKQQRHLQTPPMYKHALLGQETSQEDIKANDGTKCQWPFVHAGFED